MGTSAFMSVVACGPPSLIAPNPVTVHIVSDGNFISREGRQTGFMLSLKDTSLSSSTIAVSLSIELELYRGWLVTCSNKLISQLISKKVDLCLREFIQQVNLSLQWSPPELLIHPRLETEVPSEILDSTRDLQLTFKFEAATSSNGTKYTAQPLLSG